MGMIMPCIGLAVACCAGAAGFVFFFGAAFFFAGAFFFAAAFAGIGIVMPGMFICAAAGAGRLASASAPAARYSSTLTINLRGRGGAAPNGASSLFQLVRLGAVLGVALVHPRHHVFAAAVLHGCHLTHLRMVHLAHVHGLRLTHMHGLCKRTGWLSGGDCRSGDQDQHVYSPEFQMK